MEKESLGLTLATGASSKICKAANCKTASKVFIGAPSGTAQALAVPLNGKVPPIKECRE